MTERDTVLTLRLSRTIAAPRERLFRALTDPDEIVRWLGPPHGSSPSAEIDLRVGGHYRIAMEAPDVDVFYVVGTYKEVVPPERLVFTWRWEAMSPDTTVVTIELHERDGKTELVLSHEGFSNEAQRDFQGWGWGAALDRLVEQMA